MSTNGFSDRILIDYTCQTARNSGQCHVVLADQYQVRPAVDALNNAALFGKRMEIMTLDNLDFGGRLGPWPKIGTERGWYASRVPSIWNAKFRKVGQDYPRDLFAPLRERRRVILRIFLRPA
jgi:hypothetical protein